jgi:hypothetical protein
LNNTVMSRPHTSSIGSGVLKIRSAAKRSAGGQTAGSPSLEADQSNELEDGADLPVADMADCKYY